MAFYREPNMVYENMFLPSVNAFIDQRVLCWVQHVRQRKTEIIWIHLHVEYKKKDQ